MQERVQPISSRTASAPQQFLNLEEHGCIIPAVAGGKAVQSAEQQRMVQNKTGVPRAAYELPLLQSLVGLGGSAKPDDRLYKLVAAKMGFEDGEDEYDLVHAREKWVYTLQWVRYNLVQRGEMDGAKRGVWAVTDAGRIRAERDQPMPASETLSPSANNARPATSEEAIGDILIRHHQLRSDLAAQADLAGLLESDESLQAWMSGEQDAKAFIVSALNRHLSAFDAGTLAELSELHEPLSADSIRRWKDTPARLRAEHLTDFAKTVNRLHREFLNEFSTADGGIDWEKLVAFNSGRDKPKRSKFALETAPEQGHQTTFE